MNKSDLINEVHKALTSNVDGGPTKVSVEAVVNTVFEGVRAALARGEEVKLVGFGTFKTKARAARTVQNPRTGETVQIEARMAVQFKPGKALTEAVNS